MFLRRRTKRKRNDLNFIVFQTVGQFRNRLSLMSSDSPSVEPSWEKQIGSIIGRLETSEVQRLQSLPGEGKSKVRFKLSAISKN